MSVIKDKRKRLAITQTKLAETLGITQSDVSERENGKIPLSDAMREWLGEDLTPEAIEGGSPLTSSEPVESSGASPPQDARPKERVRRRDKRPNAPAPTNRPR